MAALPCQPIVFSLIFSSSNSSLPPFPLSNNFPCSRIHQSMLFSVFLFTLSLLSLSILIFSLYSKRRSSKKHHNGLEKQETQKNIISINTTANTSSSSETSVDNHNNVQTDLEHTPGSGPNQLSHALLLEMLPSDSPRWDQQFRDDVCIGKSSDMDRVRVRNEEEEEEEEKKKKRKKRGKKKRTDPTVCGGEESKKDKKEELVCLYPFMTSTSATQRKIKQQYDQLVKSHESNGLTLAQVSLLILLLTED